MTSDRPPIIPGGPHTYWQLEGDLFEGCNCQLMCPCHVSFKNRQTEDVCQAMWAAHVEKGTWGDLDLSGANALVVAFSPGATMYDGNWTSLLYIDDKTSIRQRRALELIFSGAAGGPWARLAQFFTGGVFQAVRAVSMTNTKNHRGHSLQVADLARLEVEAILGANGKDVAKISNLYNVIHGEEHVLSRAKHRVKDEGLDWDYSGSHGLYSSFRWTGT